MTNNDTSTFFFPLRTNVGFFDAPENYLSLTERIKQASLLYDRLVFESGIYIATVVPTGQNEFWLSYDEMDDGFLDSFKQNFQPTGGESLFMIQLEGRQPIAVPSLSGPVERRFHCEFHSTLRDIGAEYFPWVELQEIELTDDGKKLAQQIQDALRNDFDASLPETGRYLRKKILTNFSRDILVSSSMKAFASMHALYVPLLTNRIGAKSAPGFTTLQVKLPNLTHLHWEKILRLREQECLVAFRHKLIEIETAVQAAMENQMMDDVQYQQALAQRFNRDLIRELIDGYSKKWEPAGNVIFDFLISLIPIPGLSTIMTGLREGIKADEKNKSWVTAFIRLGGEEGDD